MRWQDIEDIAHALEENYPEEDINVLSLQDLEDLIRSLNDFEEVDTEANKNVLKKIQEFWTEIREDY